MKLHVREEDGVFILQPHGMLLGGKETDELEEKVKELDAMGNERLLIDLGKITFMSSRGLAVLFLAHAKYSKRGAVVKLCSMDKRIKQIVALVRLSLVYGDNVHETGKEAMESFRASLGAAKK